MSASRKRFKLLKSLKYILTVLSMCLGALAFYLGELGAISATYIGFPIIYGQIMLPLIGAILGFGLYKIAHFFAKWGFAHFAPADEIRNYVLWNIEDSLERLEYQEEFIAEDAKIVGNTKLPDASSPHRIVRFPELEHSLAVCTNTYSVNEILNYELFEGVQPRKIVEQKDEGELHVSSHNPSGMTFREILSHYANELDKSNSRNKEASKDKNKASALVAYLLPTYHGDNSREIKLSKYEQLLSRRLAENNNQYNKRPQQKNEQDKEILEMPFSKDLKDCSYLIPSSVQIFSNKQYSLATTQHYIFEQQIGNVGDRVRLQKVVSSQQQQQMPGPYPSCPLRKISPIDNQSIQGGTHDCIGHQNA